MIRKARKHICGQIQPPICGNGLAQTKQMSDSENSRDFVFLLSKEEMDILYGIFIEADTRAYPKEDALFERFLVLYKDIQTVD